MENHAIERKKEWVEGACTFTEQVAQEYINCVFSAGFVDGAPNGDVLYLKMERNGQVDTFLLLRPDEASALAWCLVGALYSHHLAEVVNAQS